MIAEGACRLPHDSGRRGETRQCLPTSRIVERDRAEILLHRATEPTAGAVRARKRAHLPVHWSVLETFFTLKNSTPNPARTCRPEIMYVCIATRRGRCAVSIYLLPIIIIIDHTTLPWRDQLSTCSKWLTTLHSLLTPRRRPPPPSVIHDPMYFMPPLSKIP